MSTLVITLKSEETAAVLAQKYQLGANLIKEEALALAQLFKNLASNNLRGVVDVNYNSSDPVAASFTATLASCATDSITIAGVTFTGSGSPTGDEQFETDGNDAADAAALAAKINAHPTLSKIVSAEANSAVVTVTCKVKGVIGNFIAVSESGSTITLGGIESGYMTNGAGGGTETASSYLMGLAS